MAPGNSKRDTANNESFQRLCEVDPVLIDVSPAIDVVPGMTRETILTSGPPMPWNDYTGGQRDAVIGAALFEGFTAGIWRPKNPSVVVVPHLEPRILRLSDFQGN